MLRAGLKIAISSTMLTQPSVSSTARCPEHNSSAWRKTTSPTSRPRTINQVARRVTAIPAQHYYDPHRWRLEMDRVFKRMPLMLALSIELPKPGDYRAHRSRRRAGAAVAPQRRQRARVRQHVQPSRRADHAGRRRQQPPLHVPVSRVDVRSERRAGRDLCEARISATSTCRATGSRTLPVAERAGMIWVTLDPKSTLPIDTFPVRLRRAARSLRLQGLVSVFAPHDRRAELEDRVRRLHGPVPPADPAQEHVRRKHAEPGDLHRVGSAPARQLARPVVARARSDRRKTSGRLRALIGGVWTIFPHVSIASFDGGGGRGVMISQLFPGDSPGSSFTVQSYRDGKSAER